MDRKLEMVSFSGGNAEFQSAWGLANDPEFYARKGEGNDQVQPWFSNDSLERMPLQQDFYSTPQPNFYSQFKPDFYTPFSPHFYAPIQQHSYPNKQPSYPENDQFFLQHQNSFPNFQTSACDNLNFQNQQPIFHPQPHAPEHCQHSQEQEHGYCSPSHAFTDFQQEGQILDYQPWSCQEPQSSQVPAAVLKQAILEASEMSFLKRGVERQSGADADSLTFSSGAGTSWWNLDAMVEDDREEEENAFALVDKAELELLLQSSLDQYEQQQEEKEEGENAFTWVDEAETQLWELNQEARECENGAVEVQSRKETEFEPDLHLNAHRLLQHEEEKEESRGADSHLYPMFRKGEEVMAYFPCEGGLFLQLMHDQQDEEREVRKLDAVQYTWVEEEKEAEPDELSLLCLPLHSEQELPLQSKHGFTFNSAQDTFPRLEVEEADDELEILLQQSAQQQEAQVEEEKKLAGHNLPLQLKEEEETSADLNGVECGFHLQPTPGHQKGQQQEEEKKKWDALHDLHLLKGEGAAIDELTCEDFDILLREADQLLQRGPSRKEEGENLQSSLHSFQLCRIKEKGVESFTFADFDALLHEDSSIIAGQHQSKEKKQDEVRKATRAPDLQDKEAAELLYPQNTTPRLEEEAAYPSILNCLSFDFTLTYNQCSLVVKVYISGDKLKTQQLNLIGYYKLQPTEPCGDVHKKGARGDGVPWFIKVHPP